ncbi:MAG: hypothetical protein RBS22_13355, partial [Spongiibacteraceae bacterium]|nr:hypothetical protein [Spongiibacteraceae bacterium]
AGVEPRPSAGPAVTAAANTDDTRNTRRGDRELVDPDNYTLGWIYYDWSGEDPGLDALAEQRVPRIGNFDGDTVTEFNRQQFVDKERERLYALYAEGRGVGSIVANITGTLGEYDPGYGEFYIDPFSPGSTITFGPSYNSDRQLAHQALNTRKDFGAGLKFNNALKAYVWKVPPSEAAELIALFERENNPGRKIYARTRLKILGAHSQGPQNRHEIETEVLDYTLFTEAGTELARFDLQN